MERDLDSSERALKVLIDAYGKAWAPGAPKRVTGDVGIGGGSVSLATATRTERRPEPPLKSGNDDEFRPRRFNCRQSDSLDESS